MASTHEPLLDKPKTSKRKFLLLIFSIATLICLTTLYTTHSVHLNYLNPPPLHQICAKAHDQASCLAMVSEIASTTAMKMNGVDLLEFFLKKSTLNIKDTIKMAIDVNHRINKPREQAGLIDCVELMESSIDRITDSISALKARKFNSDADAHAWLSTVLTNHVTCLDGLEGSARTSMEPMLSDLTTRARNSLAIFVKISPSNTEVIHPISQKFPSWVTGRDRMLLPALPNEVKANVVVAKDGSGNYKTLTEAVAAAPDKSKSRYVIHVKEGTYKENVEVGKNKKNIMIVGDGMNLTIITGRRNVVDNYTTFNSATVAAVGDGFIAQDIWFQNTAGPQKHQAVALRVGADQSVINRCRIDAYQDTLYAHSNRQFYRDCYITGTVDFIFGNAAVVLQNCKLVPRKPMSNQANMVTAQGRTDPHQTTGTSIQKCEIIASSDLEPVKGSIHSYLGRPWHAYSRTVVMQSYIGDLIAPAGWSEWDGNKYLDTLYYGEYSNRGPGAGTSKRVKWAGYHVITNRTEAEKFTVAELIGGGAWLKSTGVSYTEGL
ncbi:pectinesterase-like [Pistacia vera]|uniref:pectinesterase-like n=1 Tax=Pistacia vera TaxID=55513 RepID=UPI001262E138|nr:pectinesterase-like [Pistacia vera]